MPHPACITSANVGELRTFRVGDHAIPTGFFKKPVSGPASVGPLGLEGDRQADLRVHGGPLKAVYFYPSEHYKDWESLLGHGPLAPGSFGENLTSESLLEAEVFIGDVLRIGTAVLQVIQPRSPCYKLSLRYERPDMVAHFVRFGRPGWYTSVLETGKLETGDEIEILSRAREDQRSGHLAIELRNGRQSGPVQANPAAQAPARILEG